MAEDAHEVSPAKGIAVDAAEEVLARGRALVDRGRRPRVRVEGQEVIVVGDVHEPRAVVDMHIAIHPRVCRKGNPQGRHLAAAVNAVLLFWILRKREIYQPPSGWPLLLLRAGIAAGVMGGMLHWLAGPLQQWLISDWVWQTSRLAAWVISGAVIYFSVLAVAGVRGRDFRGQKV